MDQVRGRQVLRLLKKVNLGLEASINADMAGMDLTAAQCDVLGYLAEHGEKALHSTDLHRDLGISRAAVSALLKKLRAKGFVVLLADPADDRQKRIVLTEKAKPLQLRMERGMDRTVRRLYRDFTEEEAEAFAALLQKMYENIQFMLKEEANL
ncbi:MAG: MarR family transcriptional regulator [Enterocloster asparagiformis]|nr:MarR family transcriptional regulator [Enterocloster asparagiformis]